MLPRPARVVSRFLFLDIFRMKVHTMFVIGRRDVDAEAISVRVHREGNLGARPKREVVADILAAIRERLA
jgi:threonyl-tRNA synthetase